jgi:transcriptional regulator with XRE-family HTH domain
MSPTKATTTTKRFDELRSQIDADPARRARVERDKSAMLRDLRRSLDLTQAAVAERLEVTQENVSQIERGEGDIRLSTLERYVAALGGKLELVATFPDRSVGLSVGPTGTVRRQRVPSGRAAVAARRTSRPKKAATSAASRSAKDAVKPKQAARGRRVPPRP